MSTILQDVRYGLRQLRRNPGFTAVAILTLALGIGATTAVFSVVDRVLFRDLPYARSGELVSLGVRIPWLEYDFLPPSAYQALRREPGLLAGLTSWAGVSNCDLTENQPIRLTCARVESTFLPVLGVQVKRGRNFVPEEDREGAPPVALISDGLWRTRFGSAADVVGRHLALDGKQVEIIGVLPPDFALPTLDRADLLVPLALPASGPEGDIPLRIYGRVSTGASVGQAREEFKVRAKQFTDVFPPDIRRHLRLQLRGLRDTQSGDFRLASWTLLAAALALLSIACANVGNLLVARGVTRQRELATRVALGAGFPDLVRQILTEVLMLGVSGGIAGCLLAYALLRMLIALAPVGIPYLSAASVDLRVFLFGMGASLLCSVALGLAVAAYTPKTGRSLMGISGSNPRTSSVRRLLVGAQVAVSLMLLTCTGMFLQSLWNQQAVPLGIQTDHVVTAELVLGNRYAQAASRAAFYQQLETRLQRLPGIEAVAFSDSLPPGGIPWSSPIYAAVVQGMPPLDTGTPGIAVWRSITPDYFRTLRIPILHGRTFTRDDCVPAARAMIISASYAQRLFGNTNPVGRMISRAGGPPWYTIVGVAADVRNAGFTGQNNPEYYVVRRHGSTEWVDAPPVSSVILRGSRPNSTLEAWLRSEITALDPALPVLVRTFDEQVGELAARPRFLAWLVGMFAGIGLVVTAFGIYGLITFETVQREHEIGIRLALGATPARVLSKMLGDTLGWTSAGLAAGLIGSALLARLFRSLLFGISPTQPASYVAAALLFLTVAFVAAFLPARRAAKVDPMVALRYE